MGQLVNDVKCALITTGLCNTTLSVGFDPKEHRHPEGDPNDDTDMDGGRRDEKGTGRENESQRGLRDGT